MIKLNEKVNVCSTSSINVENLKNLKMSGQIKDFEIYENGVKIIKEFNIQSVSI